MSQQPSFSALEGTSSKQQRTQIHITIYTDGACSGNPGPGGWAVCDTNAVIDISGHSPHTTNNTMELTAIKNALEAVSDGASVTIITDSNLCIGWLVDGWKCKSNPANIKLVNEILNMTRDRQLIVGYRWTKGHANDPMNKYVDSIARKRCRG